MLNNSGPGKTCKWYNFSLVLRTKEFTKCFPLWENSLRNSGFHGNLVHPRCEPPTPRPRSYPGPTPPRQLWRDMAFVVMEMNSSCGCFFLSGSRLISLKVLNSIVLLGKSCQYVKEAKMEEKLFNPPPASTSGKPPQKSQNKCKPSQGTFCSFHHCVNRFLQS